jgi:hypothetical protein
LESVLEVKHVRRQFGEVVAVDGLGPSGCGNMMAQRQPIARFYASLKG